MGIEGITEGDVVDVHDVSFCSWLVALLHVPFSIGGSCYGFSHNAVHSVDGDIVCVFPVSSYGVVSHASGGTEVPEMYHVCCCSGVIQFFRAGVRHIVFCILSVYLDI